MRRNGWTFAWCQASSLLLAGRDLASRRRLARRRAAALQVRLDEDEKLFWESEEGIVKKQPAQNSWQRIQMWFFGIAPESQL